MLYEAWTVHEKILSTSENKVVRNQWRPCVELEQLLSEVKHNSMFGCGLRAHHGKRGLGQDTKLKKDEQFWGS